MNNDVAVKIKEIHDLKIMFEEEIEDKRNELFSMASSIASYTDLYTFVLNASETQEEFNSAMFIIRDKFKF